MSLGSSPPPAPNPQQTAAADAQSHAQTAVAQSILGNANSVTPQGTITYTKAPSGTNIEGIDIPQWTATQTLSPEEQNLFNLRNAISTNIGQIGLDASGRIGNTLGTPVDLGKPLDLSPGAVSGFLTDLGNKRLSPLLDQEWQKRESDLMNRGIVPGSEQYKIEQDAFNRQRNDAYNQLIISGYTPAAQSLTTQHNSNVQDTLQGRDQLINEISALLGGTQVTAPQQIGYNPATIQPTNVAGITQQSYQDQLANYQLQQQQRNAMLGGAFGLGAAGLMAPTSVGGSIGGNLFGLAANRLGFG